MNNLMRIPSQPMPRAHSVVVAAGLIGLISAHALSAATAKPLQIYILAGQSNMQGHAQVRTFDHIGMDPETAPLLEQMRNADGTPRVCENVWISSLGSAPEERHGRLTAGFGAAGGGPKIGPEFTFGIRMRQLVNGPILIIKTAWGGKSLHTDFRPPSAGPYVFTPQQAKRLQEQGRDIDEARNDRAQVTGRYYRQMIEYVHTVLNDIGRVDPGIDPAAGYELAGFVWFQGWNDMVDAGAYPNRDHPGGYDRYSEVLACFIRDVRRDLDTPDLPFVIGVLGVGGPVDEYGPDQRRYRDIHGEFRRAMAAPAAWPEFKGNVKAVLTEEYWDPELGELAAGWDKVRAKRRSLNQDRSLNDEQRKQALDAFTAGLFTARELEIFRAGASNAAYHYLGSAKIMARIGRAFAEALSDLSQ
jgi:alpha-galactosidase